jgi:precorrin-3B synthase
MNAGFRRGACPTLSQPMATGDGLLVRLTPTGATVPCKMATALCAAAREHGNGIIEVTSRGNIQVRGLTEDSVPAFAASLGDIGAYFGEGTPVTCDPFAGLDADELFAAHAFAACLRDRIDGLFHRLSPKVSVVVDGGGALHLDAVSADVRLRAIAIDGARVHIAVGGDARTATPIGIVASEDTVDAVLGVLATIAGRGPAARARDIIATEGADVFRRAVINLVSDGRGPSLRGPVDPVGIHSLRDGTVAVGFALAFGHTDGDTLSRLVDAAVEAGASGLRTAPDRALLVIGVPRSAVARLQAAAERLGFIVHRDDPRRRVVACAGSPICASAEIPSRALAPKLAEIVAQVDGDTPVLHVSGCAKGCACSRATPLTVVGIDGRCGVVVHGSARDAPAVTFAVDALPGALAQIVGAIREEARVG